MNDLLHDLHMSDGHPEDAADWDRGLTTEELLRRVTDQLANGECDGDELTITVRTYARETA